LLLDAWQDRVLSAAFKMQIGPVKLDPLTVVYMVFNFAVSVGIVFLNKYLFHHYHFDFATLMTCLHFLGTSVVK
jgi:hypothetical protein